MVHQEIHNMKEEEKAASTARADHGWIPGVVLIGLGLLFLANNVFGVELVHNWWALFILIPAAANLNRAWERYRRDGRWSAAARGSLTGGLLIATVAFIFLLDLNWAIFWPVLLIILGFSILLRGV